MAAPRTLLLGAFVVAACGNGEGGGDPPDARIINGCPSLASPQASPGDPIGGDTYASFAMGFFEGFCTRCHASTLQGDDRNGAPVGYDWDVEATIRDHLPEIRNMVGVQNFMPLDPPPEPTCAERQRLVRWIDADAP
jgi:hypothetical protein